MKRLVFFLLMCVLLCSCKGQRNDTLYVDFNKIYDMLYSPEDGVYFVEYENVFGFISPQRFQKDYVEIDIAEDVFFQILYDMRTGNKTRSYYIDVRFVPSVNDYILEIKRL